MFHHCVHETLAMLLNSPVKSIFRKRIPIELPV